MADSPSFHYVELPADSIERAADFYLRVFGWKFVAPPGEHLVSDIVYLEEAPEIGICTRARPAAEGIGVRPGVAVDSIDETLERVGGAGGAVVARREDVGDGYTAVFQDTEGNHVSLWEFK